MVVGSYSGDLRHHRRHVQQLVAVYFDERISIY
jgi:hypothetical protein